jgi:hypothetical protein
MVVTKGPQTDRRHSKIRTLGKCASIAGDWLGPSEEIVLFLHSLQRNLSFGKGSF